MNFEQKHLTQEVPPHIQRLSHVAATAHLAEHDQGFFFGKTNRKSFSHTLGEKVRERPGDFRLIFEEGTLIDLASGGGLDCLDDLASIGLEQYVAVDLHHTQMEEEPHPSGLQVSRFQEEMLHFIYRMRESDECRWMFFLCGIEATDTRFHFYRARRQFNDIEPNSEDPQFTHDTIQAFENTSTEEKTLYAYRLLTLYLTLFYKRITHVLDESEGIIFAEDDFLRKIIDGRLIGSQGFSGPLYFTQPLSIYTRKLGTKRSYG